MTIESESKNEASSTGLSQSELKRYIDYDPETGTFTRRIQLNNVMAGTILGSERYDGYLCIRILGKSYLAHRLAWFYMHGTWPNIIDHINGIRNDNRLCNLRDVTTQINILNRPVQINNILGVRGVKQHGNKFIARISFEGYTHYLGLFDTMHGASEAYEQARKELYGRDA